MLYRSARGSGPRLVLVHGFTQSGRSWDALAKRFEDSWEVVTVDAPGHGLSADVSADLWDGADLLAQAAEGPATWIGYSMGGRFALHLALNHPALVEQLVLVSTTAGIREPAERTDRRRSDLDLAERVLEMGLRPFVEWWLSQPLFATLPSSAAGFSSRLEGTASGLASSLRLAGTGSQEPLWSRLHELQMPVLLVAGALDSRYCHLAGEMAAAIGTNADVRIVSGAGHACHLEKPDEFLEVVSTWSHCPDPHRSDPHRSDPHQSDP